MQRAIAIVVIRLILTGILLYTIFKNAHWSVALAFALIFLTHEITE